MPKNWVGSVLVLAITLIGVNCYAANWEVGPGKTYSTVTGALDALYTATGASAFGETEYIDVYDDTYTEEVKPNTNLNPTAANRLVIRAMTQYGAILDEEDTRSYGVLIDSNYVTVDGFEIKNFNTQGIAANSDDYLLIQNNKIHDTNLTYIEGVALAASDGSTFQNNIV